MAITVFPNHKPANDNLFCKSTLCVALFFITILLSSGNAHFWNRVHCCLQPPRVKGGYESIRFPFLAQQSLATCSEGLTWMRSSPTS